MKDTRNGHDQFINNSVLKEISLLSILFPQKNAKSHDREWAFLGGNGKI